MKGPIGIVKQNSFFLKTIPNLKSEAIKMLFLRKIYVGMKVVTDVHKYYRLKF